MCIHCSDSALSVELDLIKLLEWYYEHFGICPSGTWKQGLSKTSQIDLIRRAMLTNTPIPDFLTDEFRDESHQLAKYRWHQALRRYMNHFERKVPQPNKWSHDDTIKLIDSAIEKNIPLEKDYSPHANN